MTVPSGATSRGSGWPALAQMHLPAGVDRDEGHRDELADRDLADDDLVGGGEERRRLGMLARERAEDELRHRHVRGGVDAVARDVAEHDGEAAVAQLEEVEDVAADVDLCGGLVDGADLQPRDRGPFARQQRLLHRLGELLLLLIEAGVVDRERGLLGDRARGRQRLERDRPLRVEREDGQLREQLARRCDRHQRRRRPAGEERQQQCMGAAEAPGHLGVEHHGLARARRSRLRAFEDGAHCVAEAWVGDMDRARHELVSSLVRNADHGSIDVQLLDERLGDGRERAVERERLCKRSGDLVERVHASRDEPLGLEHGRQLVLLRARLLVQPRVLHGDRERGGKRCDQRRLGLAEAPAAGIGHDQPDRLLLQRQRDRDHRGLARRHERGAHRRERRLAAVDARVQCPSGPQRAAKCLHEPRRDVEVRGRLAPTGRGAQLSVVPQEHTDVLDLQELRDSLDRRLERVGEREMRDRLGHHLEQRPRSLELQVELVDALRRAQRVSGTRRERRKRGQVGFRCGDVLGVEELQRRERGLPERQGRHLRPCAGSGAMPAGRRCSTASATSTAA